MQTKITYSNFLTPDNQQLISNISTDLSPQIQMDMSIVQKEGDDEKLCEIKLIDKIGVNELGEKINKNNIKEIIQLLRTVYNQL